MRVSPVAGGRLVLGEQPRTVISFERHWI